MKTQNFQRQIKKLEKDLVIEKYNHDYDLKIWIEAAYDYCELAEKKEKLGTKLFVLGLLLGGLLITTIITALLITW